MRTRCKAAPSFGLSAARPIASRFPDLMISLKCKDKDFTCKQLMDKLEANVQPIFATQPNARRPLQAGRRSAITLT